MKKICHIKIKNKNECTGCRACEKLCPMGCINMKEEAEGFIYPHIDEKKCANCGICKNRCPQKSKIEEKTTKVLAIKSKDSEVYKKSSSAGMAYLLAKKVIENDGVVFGCAYNKEMIPIQMMVNDIDNLQKLRGSKYVFSNTLNTYQEAKEYLENHIKVLYIGTPCQIGGLLSFLGRKYDNLFTIDIVCHGVPSAKLFKKYIEYLEKVYKKKVINYEFRNKEKARWGEFVSKITFDDNTFEYVNANDDLYYSNFLKGTDYRESCYKCKYANLNRVGDITLGDFWGIENIEPEFYSEKGVSLVLINNIKGEKLLNEVNQFVFISEKKEIHAMEKNHNLYAPTTRTIKRNTIYKGIDKYDTKIFIEKNLKERNYGKKILKKIIPHSVVRLMKKN